MKLFKQLVIISEKPKGFQTSLKRLSSGKKILGPNDLALYVAMKVKASINRLTGHKIISNAIGFLEVQDGLLETAGRIVMKYRK